MTESPYQIPLSTDLLEVDLPQLAPVPSRANGVANLVNEEDRAVHNWYRFVLSYPPHLVKDFIQRFGLKENARLLDPFCGTGTTVVEAKLNRLQGIGLEANPFPHFAGTVKTDWRVDPDELTGLAHEIASTVRLRFAAEGIDDDQICTAATSMELRDLPPDAKKLLIQDSISPLPLHKVLTLQEVMMGYADHACFGHLKLALGKALVSSISNLRFGPEVGVGKIKADAPVIVPWLAGINAMARDLRTVRSDSYPDAKVHLADARNLIQILEPSSIDAVITSPPYPNEKDYTRTTRLESVILGFYDTKEDLRVHKRRLLRSNTRGIYVDDDDDRWVADRPEIQELAEQIEQRRIELGKTSGFEKLYGRTTLLYFGGMAKHLHQLKTVLRPGAQLAYVVGDPASYLRVMIRTGELLGAIAQDMGYELVGIDLFRTRYATATQVELREEVVVLRWPS